MLVLSDFDLVFFSNFQYAYRSRICGVKCQMINGHAWSYLYKVAHFHLFLNSAMNMLYIDVMYSNVHVSHSDVTLS